jgi:Bardet-Biedl syndrome 2 protein
MGLAVGRVVPSDANKELALLNINQSVTSICAGHLSLTEERDTLVVGTPTNLLAYDVENNTDVFYKEVGCNTVNISYLREQIYEMILVDLQSFIF